MSHLALVYESAGKQTLRSVPTPDPKAGYVLVRIEAAAVNPLDYKIYDYAHRFIQKCPTVLGVDAAGEITKIGSDVTNFNVGDRVIFHCTPNAPEDVGSGDRGAFQQYALADVRRTAKIPHGIDYDSASSFPVAGNTAAGALYGQLKFMEPWLGGVDKYKGEKLVVLGGSSSVALIQLAIISGLEVITTSSPAHFDYLKSLGATTVINRLATDVASQILAVTGGRVKYVVDCISLLPTQLLAVEILEPEGKLVLVLSAQPPTKEAAEAKAITLLGTSGPTGAYVSEPFWGSVEKYLERGVLKFNKPTVLAGGLHAWEQAFDLHRQGKVSGAKIVMRPQETQIA
ncbi:chaperonin 10-like protein [Mycena leptocephala]|nr:chaperonin 10-like protein [Mycena leptocephala]